MKAYCPICGEEMKLEKIGKSRRRAILKKHRSMPEGLSCEFIITERGVEDGIK